MESKLLKDRSPEAKEVLNTIPGWILRWGMFLISFFFMFAIYSSLHLIYFNHETHAVAQVIDQKLLNINNTSMNIKDIECISIGNEKSRLLFDFTIFPKKNSSILIEIKSPDLFRMENQKDSIDVILYHKKSLAEILVSDMLD